MLDFKLPELGENIESGTVISINVAEGDLISKEQELFELETDKATLPVPSPTDGVVKKILIKEGQDVKIGDVIMSIEDQGTSEKSSPAPAKEANSENTTPSPAPTKTVAKSASQVTPAQSAAPVKSIEVSKASKDVPASPSVRRFAREIGVDIVQVPGSGVHGRITKDDVKKFAKIRNESSVSAASSTMAKALPDFTKYGDVERQPMSKIRQVTADHLSYCWQTIPHVTQFAKTDITELEKLRKKLSTKQKMTITPFLLKVMAAALKNYPQFNASVDMTTQEIVYKKYIHLGVAVDTDRGLLVPVIRDVDKKSIFEINDELQVMAEKARERKTAIEDLRGGSMTLTNLGGIGGTHFTPIVNWPEVAILGVSRGQWEQVYNKDQNEFQPRMMLPLSLSYDHRLIDGADGARFITWICNAIEQPFLMSLSA